MDLITFYRCLMCFSFIGIVVCPIMLYMIQKEEYAEKNISS